MNRTEILKQLNYKGRYTKDVKKRLNKLLKKYHPDNNKDDKMTILLLYQIKKELENGTLKYNDIVDGDNTPDEVNEFSNYQSLLEKMIKRLVQKKRRIDKKIELLYEKINFNYKTINNKQDEMGLIDIEVNELEDEIIKLRKIDVIDFLSIMLIFVFIMLIVIFKNIFFIIGIITLVILELYYLYVRQNIYIEKEKRYKKYIKIKKSVIDEFNVLDEKVKKLVEEEKKLKKEKRVVNNDIQFYSNELNKINSNVRDKYKDNSYENENKNVFVKK